MTALGPSLMLAALAFQGSATDSLLLLAHRLPESQLVLEARSRPLVTREAVAQAVARSTANPATTERQLGVARRLAAAYALAWSDSFLVREVARFAAWSPERRALKVWADSVRRAGIAAFGRDGADVANAIWGRALDRSSVIGDTAGMAAVLGNLAAGFLELGVADSAEAFAHRARALAAAVGDLRVEAAAVSVLAELSAERGAAAAARELHLRSLRLMERIGDTRGIAAAYNNLGLLAQAVGDAVEARRQFEAALALNRRHQLETVAATNLVNLAGLAALTGDFATAERFFQDALATWRAEEQWVDAADALQGLGQLEVRRGNYPAARAALLEALSVYEDANQHADALAVRQALAEVLAAQGDLQGALDELRQAQDRVGVAGVEAGIDAGLTLARADLALQLNTLADAGRLYGEAESRYRDAGDPEGEAEAQQGLGMLSLLRDDHGGAQELLERALRTQLAAGNQRGAALSRLSLGQLARARGDLTTARRELALAGRTLSELGDPVATGAVLAERAALESEHGSHAQAESLYRAGLEGLRDRVAPEIVAQLRAGLGSAFAARGMLDAAARELRAAVAEIERSGRSLALAERRTAFLSDKWNVYAQLAIVERRRGRPGAAFEVSERLRSREMLEVLGRGRIAPSADTMSALVGREQDLRRRIHELTRRLESDASDDATSRGRDVSLAAGGTRAALVRAQEAYTELLLEMRERAPHAADLVSPAAATWQDVAARLTSSEVFIEYLVTDSTSFAFVITRDTLIPIELGANRRTLARLTEFLRGMLETAPPRAADSLWRAPLQRLHRYLIAPVEASGLLARRTRLVIVPHGELHYLPFGALLDSSRAFLVERYELAFTPSASVWLALGARRTPRATTGILAVAPNPGRLPASRREVAAIPRVHGGDVRVLTGTGANEATFRAEAPARRVLHLATYGILNKHNPLFSFVELNPGGGHDGRLEVHEVFGLDLAAELVVLSACQTGLGSGALADVPAGDDWIGLTRAFLHAGASQVVATLWPVEDWPTAALMEHFYKEYGAGVGAETALARAQRTLLVAPATAHPYYWAGFMAVGGMPRRTS